jgi:hypothetical protein
MGSSGGDVSRFQVERRHARSVGDSVVGVVVVPWREADAGFRVGVFARRFLPASDFAADGQVR